MPILEIEVVGQLATDPPTERLAERIAAAVGSALAVPSGQLWVKVRKLAASSYAENGPPQQTLPVFAHLLVRTRDPSVWPMRAEMIATAVADATARPREVVHVVFEPDATGRVFYGGLRESPGG